MDATRFGRNLQTLLREPPPRPADARVYVSAQPANALLDSRATLGYNCFCATFVGTDLASDVAQRTGQSRDQLLAEGDATLCTIAVRNDVLGETLLPIALPTSQLFSALTTSYYQPAGEGLDYARPTDPETLRELFCLCVNAYSERPDAWETELELLALAVVTNLTRSLTPDRDTDADALVALLLQEITSHPETVTLAGLARRFSYNASYLSSLFREKCGRTFSELVREQRMARARMLLLSTELPVCDVARMVGYRGTSNFYATFEAHFGESPREAREGQRRA